MPGILDLYSNPANAGILSLASGLLQASGPQMRPVSFGQALGQGAQQGMQGYQQAQQAQLQNLLAQAQIHKAMTPENPFAKIDPKDFTPESIAQFTSTMNPSVLVPVRKREVGPAGQVYDPYAVQPGTVLQDPNKPFAPGMNGGPPVPNVPYQNYATGLANAGATRIENKVNAFTPASEAAQTQFMQSTRQNYEKLREAPVLINNIQEAKKIAASGNPFIGSLGDKKASIAQFFNNNFGTNIAPDELADANALRTRLFERVKDQLKKMDATPSQMQQQKMEDAFGSLTTDPKALEKIMDVTDEIVRGQVGVHNKEVKGAIERGVRFPYDPIISLPEQAAPLKQAPQSFVANQIYTDANGNRARYLGNGKWQEMK